MALTKTSTLYSLFIKLILKIFIGIVLSLITPMILFFVFSSLGYINDASASKNTAQNVVKKIQSSNTFDPHWVSFPNEFIRITPEGKVVQSNMDKKNERIILKNMSENVENKGNFLQAKLGSDSIIISYKLKSYYKNSFLNKYFILPETLMVLIILINLIVTIIISTKKTSKNIQLNLLPINNAVKNIQDNELDFKIGFSNITEFNEVLKSFQELKESLTEELEERRKSEERQRNQLAALVHDLKTPLTGAVGWADLLNETNLTQEQVYYLTKLQESTETIENLVNALMQTTLDTRKITSNLNFTNLHRLVNGLENQLKPILEIKKISFEKVFKVSSEESVLINNLLLLQSLSNIVTNSIDFVEIGGKIKVSVEMNNNELQFQIEDSGPGFAPNIIEKAFTESYMGDSSRSGINHFGMGLSIAKRNVDLMGGNIRLGKSSTLNGASVLISITIL